MRKIYTICLLMLLAMAAIFAEGAKEELTTRITVVKDGSLVMFTDDLGRKINVKDGGFKNVIAATPAAQSYIYAIKPSRLYGLAQEWPVGAERLVHKSALDTPVYGTFDPLYDSLDYDMIKASEADLVLVVGISGMQKSEITAMLDEKEEELGIPFVFVEDKFEKIPSTINRIAMIVSSYYDVDDAIELAEELLLPLYSTKNIVSYYYSESGDGLTPFAKGSEETAVMDYIGLYNVVPADSTKAMTAEEIMNADPDLIFLTDETAFMNMTQTEDFKNVRAIKEGNIYLVPMAPYNILDEFSGAGRIIGLQWLRMLSYKNVTLEELVDNADDYFEEFYHSNLSDAEIRKMLNT